MKNIKYTFIALTISFFFAGCSNDWLNELEPQGKLLESNYYQTEEEMSKGIISIYNVWKNQYWNGWSSFILMPSVASDDAVKHGDGPADQPGFYASQMYTSTSTTECIPQLWQRIYYGVYRANVVIDRVDPTSDFGKVAIAEAKMLRAIFYFDLVRYFGEGPLIKKVLTPDEYIQAKTPKQEIFEFIVQDLKDASADLPTSWPGAEKYRMTKYGAKGLLSKVYLFMASPYNNTGGANDNMWSLAESEAQDVIDNGGYALENNYDDIWWYSNEFNKESLIEISYTGAPGDFWGNGADTPGNIMGKLCGPRGINVNDTLTAGWGMDMVTDDLVKAYRDAGDSVRLHATALSEETMFEWGINQIDRKNDYTGFYSKKRTTWKASNAEKSDWGFANNERVLRLGEIYLILAEAQIMQGKSGDAAINTIRTRANLNPISGATLSDLKLERRLELAMENNRFFDLVRWGDAETVLGPAKGEFHHGGYQSKHAVWPIPQEEIDNSNGVLEQNPGY